MNIYSHAIQSANEAAAAALDDILSRPVERKEAKADQKASGENQRFNTVITPFRKP